ncbi:MAG: AMP-binding protein [candidate division NC10 bacterium]|nr:AMP-binding protein [candidate division NC10 bacterium]
METYEDRRKRFWWSEALARLDGEPEKGLNLGHELCDRHRGAGRPAIYWARRDGTRLASTFDDLSQRSSQFANLLGDLGVTKGDRVATLLPRSLELLIALLGTWKLGAVHVPLFTGFGPEAVRYRLEHSGAAVVVTTLTARATIPRVDRRLAVITVQDGPQANPGEVSFWAALERHSAAVAPVLSRRDEPAVIIYSSGSTGPPKGIQLATNFVASIEPVFRYALDLRDGDCFWPTGDPSWGWGLVGWAAALFRAVPFLAYEGLFSVEAYLSLLEEFRVTNWATSPTVLRRIMASPGRLREQARSLRVINSCGEALNAEVVRWFSEALGVTPMDHYGSTECGIYICNFAGLRLHVKPGSMGRPIPGAEAAIVDERGVEVPAGEVGFIAYRPNEEGYYGLGYWRDPERTRELYRNGWVVVGDLGRMDADGYFWFEGRADDLIKSAGYRIGPYEVESALLEHPAVAEAAVVGKPDPLRGEIVKAFVVPRTGASPGEALAGALAEHVKGRLGAHAYPREVEFVEALPLTETGKIQRFKLRAVAQKE